MSAARSSPSRSRAVAAPAPAPRYRWMVLGVAATGAGAFSVLRMGLPALGPALRDAYGLSLGQVGLAFTAVALGTVLTLVPWGMLTDRVGERPVLSSGLAGTALALAGAALAPGYLTLLGGLFLAGALGASTTGASGRAVMGWFARRERGLALGVRQMALPLGGVTGSIALPLLAGAGGLRAALLAMAGLILTAAAASALWMRDAPQSDAPAPSSPAPGRDRRLWRLGTAGALLIVAQSAVLGFLVLFLHGERGLSAAGASAVLAGVMLGGALGRVFAGRRSDREDRRIAPIRRRALLTVALLVATALAVTAPLWLLVPLMLATGIATMTWNGLAFTAAAELGGRSRAATAMSMQNTMVSAGGALAPAPFGALVGATAWPVGFALVALAPLAAWLVLRPLVAEEQRRANQRTAEAAPCARLQAVRPPSATAVKGAI
ncbi:MAG TPA: MFS transporter [Solirubrobacteraceae bacterium]|nr:MFS transporter [Solirubrobacteraceae bacterium]